MILRRPFRPVKTRSAQNTGTREATGGPHLALEIFLAFYVTCVTITWWYYMRKSFLARRVPSLAEAGV